MLYMSWEKKPWFWLSPHNQGFSIKVPADTYTFMALASWTSNPYFQVLPDSSVHVPQPPSNSSYLNLKSLFSLTDHRLFPTLRMSLSNNIEVIVLCLTRLWFFQHFLLKPSILLASGWSHSLTPSTNMNAYCVPGTVLRIGYILVNKSRHCCCFSGVNSVSHLVL